MSTKLTEYQRQVRGGLLVWPGVDAVAHCALGLAGEAGEVADLVKKSQYLGRALNAGGVVEELGDVLWYLTYLAGVFGLSLTDLAGANLYKLEARHPDVYDVAAFLHST